MEHEIEPHTKKIKTRSMLKFVRLIRFWKPALYFSQTINRVLACSFVFRSFISTSEARFALVLLILSAEISENENETQSVLIYRTVSAFPVLKLQRNYFWHAKTHFELSFFKFGTFIVLISDAVPPRMKFHRSSSPRHFRKRHVLASDVHFRNELFWLHPRLYA